MMLVIHIKNIFRNPDATLAGERRRKLIFLLRELGYSGQANCPKMISADFDYNTAHMVHVSKWITVW
jgi:hypothetical protein